LYIYGGRREEGERGKRKGRGRVVEREREGGGTVMSRCRNKVGYSGVGRHVRGRGGRGGLGREGREEGGGRREEGEGKGGNTVMSCCIYKVGYSGFGRHVRFILEITVAV
jgi:hypothetical protein